MINIVINGISIVLYIVYWYWYKISNTKCVYSLLCRSLWEHLTSRTPSVCQLDLT